MLLFLANKVSCTRMLVPLQQPLQSENFPINVTLDQTEYLDKLPYTTHLQHCKYESTQYKFEYREFCLPSYPVFKRRAWAYLF